MVKPVSSRITYDLLVPLFVTIVALLFGIFLPIVAQNSHNVFWESLYGFGFYISGFVARSYVANAFVGWIGLLVWPLIACIIVFLVARAVMRSSPHDTTCRRDTVCYVFIRMCQPRHGELLFESRSTAVLEPVCNFLLAHHQLTNRCGATATRCAFPFLMAETVLEILLSSRQPRG
jgi:hypothetical protein